MYPFILYSIKGGVSMNLDLKVVEVKTSALPQDTTAASKC